MRPETHTWEQLADSRRRVSEECVRRGADLAEARERIAELEAQVAELQELATTDALTGLPNRRTADTVLRQSIARWGRSQTPLAVLLIDVDHFKRVNDTRGHEAGDEVLRNVAAHIADSLRLNDLAARWGGEEFLVVSENGYEGATTLAERIRQRVAKHTGVTVSVGVAEYRGQSGLVDQADAAMYAAKESGRNAVRAAAPKESW